MKRQDTSKGPEVGGQRSEVETTEETKSGRSERRESDNYQRSDYRRPESDE